MKAVQAPKDLKFWTMVVHNISKHCSTRDFLWLLVVDGTQHFSSFLTKLRALTLKWKVHAVLRHRDLKDWRALVSIMVKNTTNCFQKTLRRIFGSGFWAQQKFKSTLLECLKIHRYPEGFNYLTNLLKQSPHQTAETAFFYVITIQLIMQTH